MGTSKADLLQGTLDLLILKALSAGPLHGWAISKRINQLSRDVLSATQGSLYPALYRLEDRGWIAGLEGASAEGRRIKVYRMTPLGRKQLAEQIDNWRAFSAAMNHVLGTS
jgi:PadR family transcriptional regulator, regulatory protein PadR